HAPEKALAFSAKIRRREKGPTVNPAGLNEVLDRTAEIVAQNAEAEPSGAEAARPESGQQSGAVRRMLGSVWHFFVSQSFSSLTRRIVFLNLAALVALLTALLYLPQFPAPLLHS